MGFAAANSIPGPSACTILLHGLRADGPSGVSSLEDVIVRLGPACLPLSRRKPKVFCLLAGRGRLLDENRRPSQSTLRTSAQIL